MAGFHFLLYIVMLTFGQLSSGRVHRAPASQHHRELRFAEPGKCHQCQADKRSEKTSNIAQKAAQEAKAASDAQNIAGQQAARQVKAQLAAKAVQAARAAVAVLSAKEAIVHRLQDELKNAKSVVQEATGALRRLQANADSALRAARESQDQLKTLTHAVETAKANAANAQAAANGAQSSVQEKEELLEAARRRVDELSNRLRIARQDLVNTNRAAARANAAAQEAKANANRNKRRLGTPGRARASKR